MTLAALALTALVHLAPAAPPAAPSSASPAPAGPADDARAAASSDAPPDDPLPATTTSGVVRAFRVPPPGTPEDVALWRRADEVDVALQAVRADATRVQATVASSDWHGRLDAAVAAGAVPAKRAEEFRAKLLDGWSEVAAILSFRWRVDPTRGCRYAFMGFDNMMELAGASPAGQRRLADARGRLVDCIERAEPIVRQLAAANAALREAYGDVEKALEAAGYSRPMLPVATGDGR
jgi:hypothetical protein